MSTRRFVFAIAFAVLLPATSPAESRYSLRGNGESITSARSDARALGGAETASPQPSLTGNPASIVNTDQTMFYGTYETEWVQTEEAQDEGGVRTRKDYAGLIPNLGVVAPLPGRLRFGTGLLVDRRKGGRIEIRTATESGQEYFQVYEASGNLLLFPALIGRRFGEVDVAGGLDVVLLNSEFRWRNVFGDGSGFESSDDIDKTRLWGVAWKLGARVPIGQRFVLGGYFTYPSKLDGDRRIENDDPFDDSDDLKIELGGEIAQVWSLGFATTWVRQFEIRADWVHENWEGAEPLLPIDEHVNVDRLAVGVEWKRLSSYGARWPIRAGYRTEELHVIDGKGERVREHVITAGSGFGLAGGRGLIDWFVEYGWRGEKNRTEYYERLFRFGMTLTGLEKWSRRRRPEDEEDW